MVKRRIDSKIVVWDANYINHRFMRSNDDKEFEIEQIEPCGSVFIVEVYKHERGKDERTD